MQVLSLVNQKGGCGKTTTGRCVLRLIEPSEGSVKLEGQELTTLPYRQMRQLIEKGHIYVARPPLFLTAERDSQVLDFTNNVEAAVDRVRHLSLAIPIGIAALGDNGGVERRQRGALLLVGEQLLKKGQGAPRNRFVC